MLVNIASFAFGVVLRRADAAAPRHAQHHRAGQAAARAVAHARRVADDLVDHRVDEALNWISATGFMPCAARPTVRPAIVVSASGVSSTRSRAERLLQAGGGAEHAAVDADVLAEHDDGRVVRHLLRERLGDRFDQRDRGHGVASLSGRLTLA